MFMVIEAHVELTLAQGFFEIHAHELFSEDYEHCC